MTPRPDDSHELTGIYEKLSKIETTLNFIPTKMDLIEGIKTAFTEHKENYCYRVHPRNSNGNGKDLLKIAKFIGAMIGAIVAAASGGYFLGR
jgi:hypothetical protein